MTEKLGVMLCGHGSRDKDAVKEFAVLADHLKARMPHYPLEIRLSRIRHPDHPHGLDKLKEQGRHPRPRGAGHAVLPRGHAKNDIPSVLNTYAAANDLRIDYGKELGIDPKMMRAAADRVQEALDKAGDAVPKHETLSSSWAAAPPIRTPIPTSRRSRVCSGKASASAGPKPPIRRHLPAGQARARTRHAPRLQAHYRLPLFLFTGILVDRIYAATDAVAAKHPDIEFVKAPYLNDHPQVIATFEERVTQILTGDIAMNCQMCKYRTQVLGFEAEVGAVQESHHHHVEGIGTSENCVLRWRLQPDVQDGPKKAATLAVDGEAAGRRHAPSPPPRHDHAHGHDHAQRP